MADDEIVNQITVHCPACASAELTTGEIIVWMVEPADKVTISPSKITVDRKATPEVAKVLNQMTCRRCQAVSYVEVRATDAGGVRVSVLREQAQDTIAKPA